MELPEAYNMHIAIAGNIGSGKTTLTQMLANHYGWEPRYEEVKNNPYINDYYKDIPRWSFPMEIFYLKERFRDLLDIAKSSNTIVQDRSIYEGVYVFTTNNHMMGNLDDRDFTTYMDLFQSMMMRVSYPRLMVYLRASLPHLFKNIESRGRSYEKGMPIDYLRNLNKLYDEFIIDKYKAPKLIIDVDDLDFQHNRRDFGKIIDQVDAELFGLFSSEDT